VAPAAVPALGAGAPGWSVPVAAGSPAAGAAAAPAAVPGLGAGAPGWRVLAAGSPAAGVAAAPAAVPGLGAGAPGWRVSAGGFHDLARFVLDWGHSVADSVVPVLRALTACRGFRFAVLVRGSEHSPHRTVKMPK